MEPIINPWIFYLIELFSNLKDLGFVSFLGGAAIMMFLFISGEDYITFKDVWKSTRWGLIPMIIGAILAILMPTQETMTKMLVASFITPDNINLGVEGVQAIFEYIITTAAEIFDTAATGG